MFCFGSGKGEASLIRSTSSAKFWSFLSQWEEWNGICHNWCHSITAWKDKNLTSFLQCLLVCLSNRMHKTAVLLAISFVPLRVDSFLNLIRVTFSAPLQSPRQQGGRGGNTIVALENMRGKESERESSPSLLPLSLSLSPEQEDGGSHWAQWKSLLVWQSLGSYAINTHPPPHTHVCSS